MDKTPSSLKWELKKSSAQNLYQIKSRYVAIEAHENIYEKKTSVFPFKVGYMTHPMLKKHRTHRDQVIHIFSSVF